MSSSALRAVTELVEQAAPSCVAVLSEERELVVEELEAGSVLHQAACPQIRGLVGSHDGQYRTLRTSTLTAQLRHRWIEMHGCVPSWAVMRQLWFHPPGGFLTLEELVDDLGMLERAEAQLQRGAACTDLLEVTSILAASGLQGGASYEAQRRATMQALSKAAREMGCEQLCEHLQEYWIGPKTIRGIDAQRRRGTTPPGADRRKAVLVLQGSEGVLLAAWSGQYVQAGGIALAVVEAWEAKLLDQTEWSTGSGMLWESVEGDGAWLDESALRLILEQHLAGMHRWGWQAGVSSHVLAQAVETAQNALAEV